MNVLPKRAVWVVIAILIAAALYLAMKPKPVLVDTAQILSGPLVVTVDEEGVTRVRDVYTVSSPISGKLDRISLEEGDAVTSDDTVVALIHPLESPFLDERTRNELAASVDAARSAVALAQVELQRSKTAFQLADSEYNRASRLAKTNVISERSLERAYSELQLQNAQVASAEATIRLRKAELASAEARLMQPDSETGIRNNDSCCVSLRSPVDGVVLQVFVRSEQPVSSGARILEIGDTSELEIVVDVLSSDAVDIKPGAHVAISDWGGNNELEAVVRRVDPAAFTRVSALGIEEQRVNIILDIEDPPVTLGHGYRVYTRLTVWESENSLRIPIGALFRDSGNWAVFKVDDGVLNRLEVDIGKMNDTHAEVLGGLNDGDSVVVFPNDLLKDGSLVEAR